MTTMPLTITIPQPDVTTLERLQQIADAVEALGLDFPDLQITATPVYEVATHSLAPAGVTQPPSAGAGTNLPAARLDQDGRTAGSSNFSYKPAREARS